MKDPGYNKTKNWIDTNKKIDNLKIFGKKKLNQKNENRKQSFFQNQKLFDLLKDLSKNDFKLNFCDYLKSFTSSNQDKNSKIYNLANNNLNDS